MTVQGVLAGDCLERMRELPDASVDAVVTDPPYGLEFMGQEWDTFPLRDRGERLTGSGNPTEARGFGGNVAYGQSRAALAAYQTWCEQWATECSRLLKPGGHLLSFGGPRTWHRLACGVEDAGFEYRDTVLAWVYASGFPKSRASLKPAWEPILVARKPPAGTVAANVVEHGVGELNIDACRIGNDQISQHGRSAKPGTGWEDHWHNELAPGKTWSGRWPANIAFIHGDGCQPVGVREVKAPGWAKHAGNGPKFSGDTYAQDACTLDMQGHGSTLGDPDGTETIEAWDCEPGCPVAELDRQSGNVKGCTNVTKKAGTGYQGGWGPQSFASSYADDGGASRFFFTAKAPASERVEVDGVRHPTVKPLALARWLLRLVVPPDGLVLDPFLGSGTTAEAAILEGFKWVGCEAEPKYLPLIAKRVARGEDDVAGRLFVGVGA